MFLDIQERIHKACERAGRKPSEVKFVAVTKGHTVADIDAAILKHGHRILGENRIQEWRDKTSQLHDVEWHLIGNLQRNKVKYCLPFSLIHSLNSERLADELQDFGAKKNHIFKVLVEVNVAGEANKMGVPLEATNLLVEYAKALPNLSVEGLMTVAPYSDTPDTVRPYFVQLRQLRDKLQLRELSMGMSGDFEVAIEEGATLLRIGSALFSE
ncbi:MAG: YggS family pyridoxal phosphate-dependent enzyme [Trueperaceae bacterium]